MKHKTLLITGLVAFFSFLIIPDLAPLSQSLAVGNPPVVQIFTPLDGANFDEGESILFEGTATDSGGLDLSSDLSWISDIDGSLGSGMSLSTGLSVAVHAITATVTDSTGLAGSDTHTITVNPTPTPPPVAVSVSVTDISFYLAGGKKNNKNLHYDLTLTDNLGDPVAGASVTTTLTKTSRRPSTWTDTATTDSNGVVFFVLNNAQKGCYETTVDDVVAAGLTWDGLTSTNSFCK